MNLLILVYLGLLFLVIIAFVLDGWFTVEEKNEGVLQRFGRHARICKPGLGFKYPIIDRVAAKIPLRIVELQFNVETKTNDNVFVNIVVAVQMRVVDSFKAFYELSDPQGQIESYVNGVLRGHVPNMNLDAVFDDKENLERAVKNSLEEKMARCGYEIENAILKEIDPDNQVKHEMNRINAAERALEATRKEAEAQRVRIEEEAMARANSKKFEGEGLAAQQVAIARGRAEAIELVKSRLGDCDDEEIAAFLLESNRIEGAVDMAQAAHTVVMYPYSAPGQFNFAQEMLKSELSLKGVEEGPQSNAFPGGSLANGQK